MDTPSVDAGSGPDGGSPPIRRTTAGVRAVLLVGSAFVLAAGTQLFVLTDHTDRFFAWTIKVPLTAAFPAWYRWLLGSQAAVMAGVGIALFVVPGRAASIWPWPLTPLTAQAIAAWLLGLGVVLLTAIHEDDWSRIRPATAAYVTLGVLQFIAIARYPHLIDWSGAPAWLYVAFLASVLFAGLSGWSVSRWAAAPASEPRSTSQRTWRTG